MSIKSIEKIDNEICYEYFSYFNYKLYDCPFFTQEELDLRKSELNDKSSEESFSNDLEQNINDLNIENKYIPLNLLDLSPKRESNINSTDEEKSTNLYYQNLFLNLIKIKIMFYVRKMNPKLIMIILNLMIIFQ